MNILSFNIAHRKVGTSQTPREYHDFIISGVSLRTILDVEGDDLTTPFLVQTIDEHTRQMLNVFRLKGKSRIESGRVMLYVCPECGDINCGAITAAIKDHGDKIVWNEFGYETDYGGISEMYDQVQAIEFERKSYFKAFVQLSI